MSIAFGYCNYELRVLFFVKLIMRLTRICRNKIIIYIPYKIMMVDDMDWCGIKFCYTITPLNIIVLSALFIYIIIFGLLHYRNLLTQQW